MYVCMYVGIPSIYLPTYLPIYLPTYLPAYLPTVAHSKGLDQLSHPIYLPTYLPTYLHAGRVGHKEEGQPFPS